MATRTIKIVASCISTGALILDDHGHTPADAGDKIIWQIQNGSGVKSIVSIDKKFGSPEIFSTRPHQQGNVWTGTISSSVPGGTIYDYFISWTDTNNPSQQHTFDPIISIKPTSIFSISKIVMSLLVFFGFSFFFLHNINKERKSS